MEKNLSEATKFLVESQSIVLTTHFLPDGDGLGAEVALYHYLQRTGKKVRIVNPDPVPERYQFLNHSNIIEIYDQTKPDGGIEKFDTAIIVDTSDPRRVRHLWECFQNKAKNILIFDHHPNLVPHLNGNCKVPTHLVVDEKSSSVGELLYRFFHSAHNELDPNHPSFRFSPEIALGLYVSIITDTNSFRYARTTALSHRIAADLIDYGLQPEEIYQNVYSSKTAGHLQLIGEVLAQVKQSKNGKIAWVEISKALRNKYGATSDDTESIVNYLLLIKSAEILILFREEDDHRIKTSLKSKGTLVVNHIATEFGGGGHEFAAGFTCTGSMAEIRDKVLLKLKD